MRKYQSQTVRFYKIFDQLSLSVKVMDDRLTEELSQIGGS